MKPVPKLGDAVSACIDLLRQSTIRHTNTTS